MLSARIIKSGSPPQPCAATLRLDFETRQKGRLRGRLTNGEEIRVILPRGTTLDSGDFLEADGGVFVGIEAADESLSVALVQDPLLLARIAYHLGNRHVALRVEAGRLSYLHDHVLDDMVRGLGAELAFEHAPFRPERGAYSQSHGHGHGHGHGHSHSHGHAHADHDEET